MHYVYMYMYLQNVPYTYRLKPCVISTQEAVCATSQLKFSMKVKEAWLHGILLPKSQMVHVDTQTDGQNKRTVITNDTTLYKSDVYATIANNDDNNQPAETLNNSKFI